MKKSNLMTQHWKQFSLWTILVATMLLSSCKDDKDPEPVNEEEVITRVNLIFQKINASNLLEGTPQVFSWADADGDGPIAAVVDKIVLDEGQKYQLLIELLNESNPANIIDITEEVEEEGTEHQFFFSVASSLNLSFSYADEDDNGKPIGLKTIVEAGQESTGKLTISLRHEPNKNAENVSTGDITNAGGETDLEITFDVEIGD